MYLILSCKILTTKLAKVRCLKGGKVRVIDDANCPVDNNGNELPQILHVCLMFFLHLVARLGEVRLG